jgi:hypothetical protein
MKHSILAFEVCARMDQTPGLHAALMGRLRAQPVNASFQQKWQYHAETSATLLAHLGAFELGCWDYFDDDTRAQADFKMWVNGMLSEEGARPGPLGGDPYRGEPRYLTYTMAFLMAQGSPTDAIVRQVCNIPEPQLWARASFQRILSNINQLSFSSIKGDVAYVIPRDPTWALTSQDLREPKFHYLRRIT